LASRKHRCLCASSLSSTMSAPSAAGIVGQLQHRFFDRATARLDADFYRHRASCFRAISGPRIHATPPPADEPSSTAARVVVKRVFDPRLFFFSSSSRSLRDVNDEQHRPRRFASRSEFLAIVIAGCLFNLASDRAPRPWTGRNRARKLRIVVFLMMVRFFICLFFGLDQVFVADVSRA